MRRVGIFGWGVVAPKSPNIEAFEKNLHAADSWLQPFNGFGPDNFLVGMPAFDFGAYRDWVVERFKSRKFSQLDSKMGLPVKYAIGAYIQALGQNPGLSDELSRLGTRAHVYIGTGLGDLPTQYEQSLTLYRAQRCWNHFWAAPEHNSVRQHYAARGLPTGDLDGVEVPPAPDTAGELEREQVEDEWWRFWAERSPQLREFLDEYRKLEGLAVEGDVESGKLSAMKEKRRGLRRLRERWGAPQPPWEAVSANLIWNIDNIAAAQISMMGQITGMAVSVGAACSTFGVGLKMALDAIRRDEADAVVLGATDPPPHPLLVGSFYNARVISADAQVSKPLTELRGTHVAGGSVVWIVGDMERMTARGFRPLGMEPLAVGVTSDADHIITPSQVGPTVAMRSALRQAQVDGG
ncbi:MAG: beta-ketoacyl synthase N-terminal-like domain-containing protein, partial [Thermoanaerobaculia bacterium]